MQNLFIALIVVALAGGSYYWYTAQEVAAPEMSDADHSMDIAPSANDAMNAPDSMQMESEDTSGAMIDIEAGADVSGAGVSGSASASATLKEITVTSTGMAFNQKTLSVKKGDRVRITYTNGGGTHDLKVDGYNVGTRVISGGASETFEFVADKAGTFEYYCSVGNHRAMGMKGTLTVSE